PLPTPVHPSLPDALPSFTWITSIPCGTPARAQNLPSLSLGIIPVPQAPIGPISSFCAVSRVARAVEPTAHPCVGLLNPLPSHQSERKSTRLNSRHVKISN